jgi:hypothetical protein
LRCVVDRGGGATLMPATWVGRENRSKLESTSTWADSLSTVGAWDGHGAGEFDATESFRGGGSKGGRDFQKITAAAY